MCDKEILAQLKKSYENIYDITENGSQLHCGGQLDNKNTKKLHKILEELNDVYYNFYNSLEKSDLVVEYKKEFVGYISDIMNSDYMYYDDSGNEIYITCGDINYCWYNDDEFIQN